MVKTFINSEQEILSFFPPGSTFRFKGKQWVVRISGKPRSGNGGEPKTDIYIAATHSLSNLEIKISFKKSNADFLENKITSKRARQIFGNDWQNLINNATLNLEASFKARPLIYKDSFGRTEAGSITLGWKFELVNKPNGMLSGQINLTLDQVQNVYSGRNLDAGKRNASIDGRVIKDSGVANYILIGNSRFQNAQEIMDSIISIEDYAKRNPEIYFACKAINLRTLSGNKYDGNRPLAVSVNWEIVGGKLKPNLVFDNALNVCATYVAEKLKTCMSVIAAKSTRDLTDFNVYDYSLVHISQASGQ